MEVGHRPWGNFYVLDEGPGFKVKRIEVNPGCRLSLQSHAQRAESCVVASGTGKFVVGDEVIHAAPAIACYIGLDQKHRMINDGTEVLVVIEVQHGSYLGEDDIQRFSDDYGRVGENAESKV